ncbi:carbon-nitrogen hydrolase [Lanmaoa asiatica]|nr:carbon-nitrogen hydrolase [Lanmaoa asiatica]
MLHALSCHPRGHAESGSRLTPRSVDLVCFPEMIFSGPTSTFCAELARHLHCHVVAGLPERLDSEPDVSSLSPPTPGANTALLYDATPDLLHTYRKSNLFTTDLTWARPGPGFTALDLPLPLGRVAVAICNDVNVRGHGHGHGVAEDGGVWRSIEAGPYELAGYCRREGVRVLVLLNAWLGEERGVDAGGDRIADGGNGPEGDDTDSEEMPEDDGLEPDWEVLNYWAMRLRPLWAKEVDVDADMEGTRRSETSAEIGKTFAGSSAMFSMRPGSGKPRLLHFMGKREEGVSVWTARVGSHDAGVVSSSSRP